MSNLKLSALLFLCAIVPCTADARQVSVALTGYFSQAGGSTVNAGDAYSGRITYNSDAVPSAILTGFTVYDVSPQTGTVTFNSVGLPNSTRPIGATVRNLSASYTGCHHDYLYPCGYSFATAVSSFTPGLVLSIGFSTRLDNVVLGYWLPVLFPDHSGFQQSEVIVWNNGVFVGRGPITGSYRIPEQRSSMFVELGVTVLLSMRAVSRRRTKSGDALG